MLPPAQPANGYRFLCDRMLARLCRRLRAAGYDTEFARPDDHDGDLLRRAIRQGRLLLSCDRKIAEHGNAAGTLIVLASNDLEGAARTLMETVPVDWLFDPFSRCLMDNGRLHPADGDDADRLPDAVRHRGIAEVFLCPNCRRLYWPGSHVRRMRSALDAWQRLAGAGNPSRLSHAGDDVRRDR